MIDIFKDLESTGFPVYQQGTAPEQLPESLLTVWNDYSEDILHGDNKPAERRHDFTVYFYTKDFSSVYTGLQAAINALKLKGYTISGNGYDMNAWEGYAARAVDVIKIEEMEV